MDAIPILQTQPLPLPLSWEGLDLFLKSLSSSDLLILGSLFWVAMLVCLRLWLQTQRLRVFRRSDIEFMDAFRLSEQPLELYLSRKNYPTSPSWKIYETACRELCQHLTAAYTVNQELVQRLRTAGRISPSQMKAIRTLLEHSANSTLISLRPEIGRYTVFALPVIGFIGTLWFWVEDSLKLNAFSFYPALVPLIISLLLVIPIQFWRSAQQRAIELAKNRTRQLIAFWTRDVERHLVDHRKPLENLPSLTFLNMEQKEGSPSPSTPSSQIGLRQ